MISNTDGQKYKQTKLKYVYKPGGRLGGGAAAASRGGLGAAR